MWTPEAQDGGVIAIIEDNDIITISAEKKLIHVHLSDEEIKARLSNWKKPDIKYKRGIMAKYVKTVSASSEGAVTDKF